MKNKSTASLSLRKVLLSTLVAAPMVTLPAPLWAVLPDTTSANVSSSAGAATVFTPAGTTLSISTPDRSILTWGAYGVAAGDTHIFTLPASTASVLNRVTGGAATAIDGNLTSNGRVFILNPDGITVGAGAVINTAGLGLSGVDEANFNFANSGNLSYFGTADANGDVSVASGAVITVGSTGNVTLAGDQIAFAGNINAGVLDVNAKATAGAGVTIGGAANTRVGGALDSAANRYGTLNVTTGGSNVDASSGGGVVIVGGTLKIVTNGGNVTQTGTGISVGDTNAAGTLNINTAVGNAASGTGSVVLSGINGNGKALNVTLKTGATTLVDDSDDNIQLNASSVNGNLNVTSNAGSILSGGDVTMVGAGRVIALSAPTAGKSITFKGPGDLSFAPITSNNANNDTTVSLTSTTGALATAGITARNIVLTANGNITQTGVLNSTRNTTIDSTTGSATLTLAGNSLANLILRNSPSGISIVEGDATGLVLANNTLTTGAVEIETVGGGVVFGAAAGDTIRFGSTLGIETAGGSITDVSDNIFVSGALTLTAGAGDVLLDGGTTNTNRLTNLKSQFGQINVVSGANASFFEQSTLNLGAIAITGNLQAYSLSSIVNSGRLQIGGTTLIGAGTAAAPGSISLDFDGAADNTFTGAISLMDDLNIFGLGGGASIGNYLAGNVSIVAGSNINFGIAENAFFQGITGAVSLKTTGVQALTAGALRTTGAVTLASETGNITATNAGNRFSNLTVTSGGSVLVSSGSSTEVRVNATLSSATPGQTASFTSTAAGLSIGNFTSNYTGLTTFATTGGTRAITDAVAGINIFGDVSFSATGAITINDSGHSFGGVTVATTANNSSATIVEGGGLRLMDVAIHGNGSFTATSNSGSILQTAASTGITVAGSGLSTFSALNGSVTLNDGAENSIARVAGTAGGDFIVDNNVSNVALGNLTATGKLTVTTDGDDITQVAGTSLNVFDTVTLTSAGAGVINLSNSGNRLGAVIAQTGTGAISLREDTTLNLKSVVTEGVFNATSDNGSIIDTVDATVASNFIDRAGAGTIGVATFSAPNGSITLDLAGNDFGTIGFTAGGNVSVIDQTGDLLLAASTVGGTFDVTNTGGNIGQTGTLLISGNTSFTATAGGLTLNNASNRFGALRFVVGGNSIISEETTMNLRSGSVASGGSVTLNTGGDFVTSGPGGSSFTQSLTIAAQGTIIPGPGSLLVVGTLTVFSPSTKDLSGLSLSGNLAGNQPVNLGDGAYTGPGQ